MDVKEDTGVQTLIWLFCILITITFKMKLCTISNTTREVFRYIQSCRVCQNQGKILELRI